MRVAALNDIEGNLAALEAVLAEAEAAGVEAVVCGGDVVTGPFLTRTDYDLDAAVASIRSARAPVDEQLLGQLLEPPARDETTARFEAARGGRA